MKKAKKATTTPAKSVPVQTSKKVEKPASSKKVVSPKVASAVAAAVATKPPAPAVQKAVQKSAKTPESKPAKITVIAQVDVGFGNMLYLRGEGAGLNWENGVPMECIADDKWCFVLSGVEQPVALKFLLNDLIWSAGEDYVITPGDELVVTPAF